MSEFRRKKQLQLLQKYQKNSLIKRTEQCLTAKEAFKKENFYEYDDYHYDDYDDWQYYDAVKALKNEKIIVYSETDFKQGSLVSPSRKSMERGYITPNAKTIPLDQIVWYNAYQGYIADLNEEFKYEFQILGLQKTIVWKEVYFNVEAGSYEEAKTQLIEKIKHDNEYLTNEVNRTYYYDYDTEKFLSPAENNGEATFKLIDRELDGYNDSEDDELFAFFDNKNHPQIVPQKHIYD